MPDLSWWEFTIKVAVEAQSQEEANVTLDNAVQAVERAMPHDVSWTIESPENSREAER